MMLYLNTTYMILTMHYCHYYLMTESYP